MRSVLRIWTAALAMVLTLGSCASAAVRGSQPETKQVGYHGHEIEVDAAIADAVPLLEELARKGMSTWAVWTVPGAPALRLAFVERPATETSYGPQLVAVGVDGDVRVLHESPRLYDDNFVAPTFFAFSDRTLLLADHGSEDAYGVVAWSIENGSVRDLGQLQIAHPEDRDVFTQGVGPTARVEIRNGKYVITIPGPLLVDPQGKEERQLAKKGAVVTFKESADRFEIAPP